MDAEDLKSEAEKQANATEVAIPEVPKLKDSKSSEIEAKNQTETTTTSSEDLEAKSNDTPEDKLKEKEQNGVKNNTDSPDSPDNKLMDGAELDSLANSKPDLTKSPKRSSKKSNTARKGSGLKTSEPSSPKSENSSPKEGKKDSPNKSKKNKRRHFRGGTYRLYLTPRSIKKPKKKTSKSPDTSVQGEDVESSVTGTETTGSFIDSTDEGSYKSEDARTISERSYQDEDSSPNSKKDQAVSGKDEEDSLKRAASKSVAIKVELIEEAVEQKESKSNNHSSDHHHHQEDDQQSTDTLLSAPMSLSAKKTIPSTKTFKDGSESIALSVKSRQRIKRRRPGDRLFEPIEENINLENEPPMKKPRRNSALANSGLGSSALANSSLKVIANLNNDANSSNPKMELFYDTELPLLMCTCQSKPLGSTNDEAVNSKIFCQAIDTIDEKLVGCCNEVSTHQLFRPSNKIPFTAMCEVHLWRLKHHQCCPVCGIFCSQGIFLQCNATTRGLHRNHLFHPECKIVMKNSEVALCPHCGCDNKMKQVALELNTPQASTFYLTQKALLSEPLARMTFCSIGRNNTNKDLEEEDIPSKTFTIAESGVILSSAGLPAGSGREQLEQLLDEIDHEKLSVFSYAPEKLYSAAKNGEIENVLYLLALVSDPNQKFSEHKGDTALHVASVAGHLVTVHLLLQSGASLEVMNNRLYTPLMVAIEARQLPIVQYLLKVGAKLTAKGDDGTTAIHLAARCGSVDICKVLLDTGKSMPNTQDDGGWTPIVWACEHSHLALVKLLIERGADPNIRDNEENVALHWSAYSGNVDISQILLDLGCDIQIVNEHGDTPLHIAARQNNYESVVLFLARGANTEVRNKEDEIPIMCCTDQSSPTYTALMMNSKLKRFTQNRPMMAEKVVHTDISRGKEFNPIQCVNGVDEEKAPFDFLYIIKNCETSPINIDRTITSLQSCQCEDDCTSSKCTCATISFKCWYDNEGRLLPEFNMPDPPMIFECNRACTCWKSCNNRVLQHGILSRLQLFRTEGKGWGVRTLKDIPRGTFICEYIGEVISDSEADQREDDSYLFDLDNRDGETYCLDARYYGNVSRFVNHLCEPNLVPVKVFVEHQDLSFPRIAFFSSRDIRVGEELGFDYGEKFWVIKYKWFTCACSSRHCKYSKETIHQTLESYYRRLKEDHPEEDVESVPLLI